MVQNKRFPPVIHIGYPKSASTTLQKHLFNKHPAIYNLGLFPTQNIGRDSGYIDQDCLYLRNEKLGEFYYNLVMLEIVEYANSYTPELFRGHIQPLIDNNKGKIPVFSNERFTSVFYSHDDIGVKADRLKEIFPEAKIIVVIRNQLNLIKSQYRDHPFDPRSFAIGKPVSLDKWVEIAFESDEVHFLNSLKYYDVVDYYAKLFGRENIGVFLVEELATSIELFSEKISGFIGIDPKTSLHCLEDRRENISVSARYNVYRQVKRKILSDLRLGGILPEASKEKLLKMERKLATFLKKGDKKDYSFSQYWLNKLNEFYAESNTKLQQEYNIGLEEYGYPHNLCGAR